MAGKPDKAKRKLKTRISKAKRKLPANWKDILVKQYPEYNTVEYANKLRNVYSGQQAPSEELCERIEALIEK